jgi:2-desacetyl-2-hydroxyethyl bacteriochlorophyllide A dehydrogenase
MKMKGLYFSNLHHVELRELDVPQIQNPTDVIIRITLTTICGSDLHLIHGLIPSKPGYVLGHEYVGVIEQVGSAVKNFKPGDRVIGPPSPFCGQCINCLNDNYSHCINGSVGGMHGGGVLDGTHAEFIRVPFADSCLLHVPDDMTDEEVIFIFDILSTGYSSVKMANIQPGDNVVVFGAGPVGLAAIMTAKLYSPSKIIIVEIKNKFRMDSALKMGATHSIFATDENVLESIYKLTDGRGANVAIDASGAESAIQQATKCVGVKGKVSLIGIPGDVQLPLSEVFYKNITINMGLGSLNLARTLLELIKSKQIDISHLITHRMRLDEIEKAIELFENKNENVIKILIRP